MKEQSLRALHRWLGALIVIFLVLQVGSGLILSVEEMVEESETHEIVAAPQASADAAGAEEDANLLHALHHGGGETGGIYRVILAGAALVQAGAGVIMFLSYLKRKRARS